MKIIALCAAAMLATTAGAQTTVTHTTTRTTTDTRPAMHRSRQVCTVHVYHGRRTRTCRTVRY